MAIGRPCNGPGAASPLRARSAAAAPRSPSSGSSVTIVEQRVDRLDAGQMRLHDLHAAHLAPVGSRPPARSRCCATARRSSPTSLRVASRHGIALPPRAVRPAVMTTIRVQRAGGSGLSQRWTLRPLAIQTARLVRPPAARGASSSGRNCSSVATSCGSQCPQWWVLCGQTDAARSSPATRSTPQPFEPRGDDAPSGPTRLGLRCHG
jgi:hypothetical protein